MSRIKKHKLSKHVLKEEKKVGKLSKEMWITLFIATIMILSVFGILFSSYNSQDSKNEYNGHKFIATQYGWSTKLDGQQVYFTYHPSDLESIDLDPSIVSLLDAPVFVILFDPESEYIDSVDAARLQLAQVSTSVLNKGIVSATTRPSDTYNLTVLSCENATETLPIIYLASSNSTSIALEDNCVILRAKSLDWIALTDRLLYGLLRII